MCVTVFESLFLWYKIFKLIITQIYTFLLFTYHLVTALLITWYYIWIIICYVHDGLIDDGSWIWDLRHFLQDVAFIHSPNNSKI